MTTHYSIKPRYTSGSPALVSQNTADQLAMNESAAHHRALTGVYGELEKSRAWRLGLDGIVEAQWEEGGAVHFRDMITGKTGQRTSLSWPWHPGSDGVTMGRASAADELVRLRAIENAALRVASSRRGNTVDDAAALDALDTALTQR